MPDSQNSECETATCLKVTGLRFFFPGFGINEIDDNEKKEIEDQNLVSVIISSPKSFYVYYHACQY